MTSRDIIKREKCKMRGVYLVTPPPRGQCNLEVENVSVNFSAVDFGVRPLYTVRSFFRPTIIKNIKQIFITSNLKLIYQIIEILIILNPQDYIPGLIISPTLIGLVGQAGLIGGGHLVGCLVYS